MTLGTFDALLSRRNEELNRLQFHAGIVAAEVFNRLRPEDVDPIDALEFVPEWKKKYSGPQSLEEQIFVLTAAMGCGPAKPGEGFDRGARLAA